MDAAIARGLPEVGKQEPAHDQPVAIVASGPSIAGQLDTIRRMRKARTPIVAVRGAHDYLIEHGILPDYAVTVDPLPDSWTCFERKAYSIHYLIASQCHSTMFEHLAGFRVTIWHLYMKKGQVLQKDRLYIGGGTTSGLRAISLFYILGYRHFALFGFDSCLSGQTLRIDGSGAKPGDAIHPIWVEGATEPYWCNPAMSLQAQHFQDFYTMAPDARFYPYGDGLIPAIIRKREQDAQELAAECHVEQNDRISFIHSWNSESASYRYRAEIPASEMGASLNDFTAGTLIFAKPQSQELMEIGKAKARGQWVVVDFCDDHFEWPYYLEALRLADAVTCNTVQMAIRIHDLGRTATVVPDPYEYPLVEPHCEGRNRLLWFGHAVNKGSLERIMPALADYPLRVVSNFNGAIPWSREIMLREFAFADIVILPATEPTKSANRAVEAIRRGCFVVAEPHPALMHIPGIWIGNIKEGVEWTQQHPQEANLRLSTAQNYVTANYSPRTVSAMWRTATKRPITSAAAENTGMAGSMSMDSIQAPI